MRDTLRAEGHMSFVLAEAIPGVLKGEDQGTSVEKSLGGSLLTLIALFGLVFASAASGQTFTEFTVPTASSAPQGIGAGPDGNLWFTESAVSANKIGRITENSSRPSSQSCPSPSRAWAPGRSPWTRGSSGAGRSGFPRSTIPRGATEESRSNTKVLPKKTQIA